MSTLIQPTVLMGLLAAFFWDGGDFSGGMGAKYAGGTVRATLCVVLLSHFASFSILISIALLRGDTFPHGAPLLCGLAAGVTGGLSLVCFYIALARGAMGAAAAISGLVAAAIPAAFSILADGSPGALRLSGFLVAGAAIWLVAAAPTGALEANLPEAVSIRPSASTMLLAIVAGAGFGLYFVLLKLAGLAASGLAWPMATARMASLTTCSVLLLCLSFKAPASTKSIPARLSKPAILWSLSTALLDTSGNLLFLAATRTGRLDVAAVLASLYPATTILLAGLVLKERLSRRQGLGMVIAAAAVVMITL
jgi:drug/metabolite transporter (DMT)-like permease